MTEPEVVIVGGGPAGSATALNLALRGRSCLLVERTKHDHWRVGETLPPRARSVLSAMGLWGRFLREGHLPSEGWQSSWGTSGWYDHHCIFSRHGTGWHLDRSRFDAMLTQAAADAGAEVLLGFSVRSLERHSGQWQLSLSNRTTSLTLGCRFLVDATGRSAWVARSQGSRWLADDRLLAIVGLLKPKGSMDGLGRHLFLEAVEGGWWYSAPLPDGCLVATYMTDKDTLIDRRWSPERLWRMSLGQTRYTAARAVACGPDVQVRVRLAHSGCLDTPTGAGWLAVGDAAGAFDPLSSDGITKSLADGKHAAEGIGAMLDGSGDALEAYDARLRRRFSKYLDQRAYFYSRERRWPHSPFWRNRWRSGAVTGERLRGREPRRPTPTSR